MRMEMELQSSMLLVYFANALAKVLHLLEICLYKKNLSQKLEFD